MRYFLLPALLALVFGVLGPGCAQQAGKDVEFGFSEKGLSSIRHGGVELLDPQWAGPTVQYLRYPQPDGTMRQVYEPRPVKQSFDAQMRILVQEYDWGKVEYGYTVAGNRLDVQIALTNATKETIGTLNLFPLRLLLPHLRQNLEASFGIAGRPLVDDNGVIAVVNWEMDQPASLGIGNPGPVKDGKQGMALTLSTPEPRVAKHPIVDNAAYFNSPGRPIAPGATDRFKFSLVFGKAGGTQAELCPDYYQAYTKKFPMDLNWPDRRPIGTIFYAHPNMGWKTNPRGFNFGKANQNDITTDAGLADFKTELMKYADRCVEILKAMNAQGVIIWDLEGEEFWHPLSYIGDPRMLPQVAPEMDKLADEFMKKFRDAGLKIGVTIRPTEVYYREGQAPRFWHRDMKDPVALMSEKIAYAQKRWGCTIFYMDSNVFGEGFDTKLPPNSGVPWTMPTLMIKKLHEADPDCLIIPEWSLFDYYRYSAPYSSPNLRQLGTDPATRAIYPKAFRVVAVNAPLMEELWEAYLNGVRGGDILLFPTWYPAQENELVRLVYREAEIRRQSVLALLKKIDQKTLLAQAKSPDETVRYYVAALLANFEAPESQAALVALLDDASPLVRKSALTALRRFKTVDDAALTGKLIAWLQKPSDPVNGALRPFVADLLGHMGEAAVPGLLQILQGNQPQAAPYAYRALAATGTTNEQAIAFLMKPLEAEVGKDPTQETAIKALGDLKAKAAVPVLLKILDDNVREHEFIRQQAIIALGKIGDKSAIEPLVNHFNRGYSTVVVYSIQPTLDNALRALTGQQYLIGKNEWQQWWVQQKKP